MDVTEYTFQELQLPVELWDRIIDHLHDDKRALACTSVVCQAWTPSSRFHLFREVHFDRRSPVFRFAVEVPHLAAYIRTLTLATGPCTVSDLRGVLDAMPGLHKLCLRSSFPLGLPPARERATPIPQLEFSDCDIPVESLLNILSLFTFVGHLTFSRARTSMERIPSEPPAFHTQSPLPVINQVSAVLTKIEIVRQVVQQTPAVGNLHTLVLTSCITMWKEVEQVTEVLTTLRSTLRRLELAPFVIDEMGSLELCSSLRNWRPEQLWEKIGLAQCVSLETLHLFRCSKSPSTVCVTLLVYLAACKAAPPGLRTLCVHMQKLPASYSSPEYAARLWEDLDTMVHARADLAVTLEVCETTPKVERFRAFVAEHLPGALGQGRLLLVEKIVSAE